MDVAQILAGLAILSTLVVGGCQSNPFLTPQQQQTLHQQPGAASPFFARTREIEQKLSHLDADNRDLQSQLAQERQQRQLVVDQLELFKRQLSDTVGQLTAAQGDKAQSEQQLAGLLASSKRGGAATLTSNNSYRAPLDAIQIPGVEVRQEGDVIRIELPSDQLFRPGTAQLQPGGIQLLDEVSEAVSRSYGRQRISVEGHVDNSQINGGLDLHQYSASQAAAVFQQLTQRARIPREHLTVVAHGANFPRVSNATPAGRARNRRIELVVYPETAAR